LRSSCARAIGPRLRARTLSLRPRCHGHIGCPYLIARRHPPHELGTYSTIIMPRATPCTCVAHSQVVGTISSRSLSWRALSNNNRKGWQRRLLNGVLRCLPMRKPGETTVQSCVSSCTSPLKPRNFMTLADIVCDCTTSDPAKHGYGRHY
jgi:hypothetical protein